MKMGTGKRKGGGGAELGFPRTQGGGGVGYEI